MDETMIRRTYTFSEEALREAAGIPDSVVILHMQTDQTTGDLVMSALVALSEL